MKEFWKDLRPAAVLTLAFSFLLSIYAPLELYFTNMEEFHFDALTLLPELLKLFLALTVAGLAAFALCRLIYVKFFEVVLLAGGVAYLCTYIQGMFLSGSLPALDGTAIDWSQFRTQYLISAILWAVVGLLAILLVRFLHMRRVKKMILWGCVFLSAVLLVTVATLGIQNGGFSRRTNTVITDAEEYTMSTDQNFVILVVDAVDSETVYEMMETTHPQFKDTLEDFTYYPNTVSAYPFTKYSIPYIFTGVWNENQEDFNTFTTKCMDGSQLLSTLEQQNYRMGAYEEDLVYDSDNIYRFENVKESRPKFTGTWAILKPELKLVWYKYAPYPLKQYVSTSMDDFRDVLDPGDGLKTFTSNNRSFYEDMLASDIVTTADRCFRFIHIEGAHVPYKYNKNVEIINKSSGSYPQNIECTMTIVEQYLQKLRDAGVYDNSAVMIMGDHGYCYHEEGKLEGRCNAFLAVKGVGERHEMRMSDAPISYEDLQTAYQRLLSGSSGDQVFDAKEGEQRQRRALLYWYTQEDTLYEYSQTGHAFDIETMRSTEKTFQLEGKKSRVPRSSASPAASPGASPTKGPAVTDD